MRHIEDLITQLSPGDRVFLRADLNVPLVNGKITDTNRIEAILPTLRRLLDQGVVILMATHLGRPKGHDSRWSTAPIARVLHSDFDIPIEHVEEFPPGEAVKNALDTASDGSVLLLENLRFDPREKANDLDFAQGLVRHCKYYVNDAFGCCHRSHASVSAAASILPAFSGFLIQKELEILTEIRDSPKRPFWVIAGGAKVKDKMGVLAQLGPQLDGVVCTGGLANTLLAGEGIDVGASRTEPDSLSAVKELLSGGPEPVLPVDFVAGDDLEHPSEVVSIQAGDPVPEHLSFFDIGEKSLDHIKSRLQSAQTIFWNGPAGVFETTEYSNGTREIARFLAHHAGRVVIGGGDSAAAVRQLQISDRFHHVSTGGGASLEFLEGRTLPGLEALSKSCRQDNECTG